VYVVVHAFQGCNKTLSKGGTIVRIHDILTAQRFCLSLQGNERIPGMPVATIQVKFFASLTPFTPRESDRFPISSETTVKTLLEHLGVPLEKAHLIFVNGVRKTLDTHLNGGDRVGVFPPVAGG